MLYDIRKKKSRTLTNLLLCYFFKRIYQLFINKRRIGTREHILLVVATPPRISWGSHLLTPQSQSRLFIKSFCFAMSVMAVLIPKQMLLSVVQVVFLLNSLGMVPHRECGLCAAGVVKEKYLVFSFVHLY